MAIKNVGKWYLDNLELYMTRKNIKIIVLVVI